MIRVMKIVISILLLALALAGCSSDDAPSPVLQIGSPAPDFHLQSLDGQVVTLSGMQGRPVMLNFWATWCGPCQVEMPFIQEVFEDEEWTEQGLVILAVNLRESPSEVKEFMEGKGLSFTVLLDAELEVAGMYNASRIPVTYFIDKNGIMRDGKLGPFASKAEIDWRLLNSIMEAE